MAKTASKGRKWTVEQKLRASEAFRARESARQGSPNGLMVVQEADVPTDPKDLRIVELKMKVEALKSDLRLAQDKEDYELEVWNRTQFEDVPYRWKHFHCDGDGWLYHERINFYADSGYGVFLFDRALAMLKNAFGENVSKDQAQTKRERFGPLDGNGNETYSVLPKFDKGNVVEVVVRIRPNGNPPGE